MIINLKKIVTIMLIIIILFNAICPSVIAANADTDSGTKAEPIDDAQFEFFSNDGILSLDGIVRYFIMGI